MTTLHRGRSLSLAFIPAEFSSIAPIARAGVLGESDLGALYRDSKEPSGTYRLALIAATEGGRYKKRVLEISRQSSNVVSPFKSILVYERTLDSTAVDFDTSNLKNVISASPKTE